MRLIFSSVILGALLCSACAMQAARPSSNTQPVVNEKSEIENANKSLGMLQYEEALARYQKFQVQYPTSKYFMAARLGEAESLEGLEHWSEAVSIYKSVYDATVQLQPEISTQALYRLSFCYEALGEDIKAVASLLDSLKKKNYLPVEIGAAEIPARLAMLYGKVQNWDESNKYMQLAQKGIESLQGRKDIPRGTLAKAYFEMGSVSMNQISSDNFSQAVLAQKTVQRYLFRAINLQISPWSEESANKLKKNYLDLWNALMQMPGVEGVDAEALARNRRTEQVALAAEFLDLIQSAEYYRPLEEAKMNSLEKGFFPYLADLKNRTQDLIYRPEGAMELTEESQKLNALKREGHIKDVPREKSLPPKSAQDPNL